MPPNKAKQLQLEQRRLTVAGNILAGLNYRDIAAGLGVSLGTIANDAKVVLERMRSEQVATATEAALVDLRRLDVALNAIWTDVKAGKPSAIATMLRILERRAQMLGYDEQVFNVNLTANIDISAVRNQRWAQVTDRLGEALADNDEQQEQEPNNV